MNNSILKLMGLITCLCFASVVGHAQTTVTVEEHWSPYQYPREITVPAGQQVHIVQKGDTLWGIAAHYFNDPLLWPHIYQANTYIQDPDLIYPGDPILVAAGMVVDEQTVAEELALKDEEQGPDAFAELDEFSQNGEDGQGASEPGQGGDIVSDRSESTTFGEEGSAFVILPAGTRGELECSTYLYPSEDPSEELPFQFKIVGSEDRLVETFGVDAVLYLNRGKNQGIMAGEEFSIRRVLHKVFHPNRNSRSRLRKRGDFIGHAIDQVGRLRILAVQDNAATAIVIDSCSETKIGDFLVPYEQEPIPLITEFPVADRYQSFPKQGGGSIILAEDSVVAFGAGHITNIDLGYDKNLAPGDLFIIYRANPNTNPKKGLELPDLYLGHGVILKTDAHASIMKIIEGYVPMVVGDLVVPFSNAQLVQ